MAPEVGLEPTTNRLTADRSTTELLRIQTRTTSKSQPLVRINPFAVAQFPVPESEFEAIASGDALIRGCDQASLCRQTFPLFLSKGCTDRIASDVMPVSVYSTAEKHQVTTNRKPKTRTEPRHCSKTSAIDRKATKQGRRDRSHEDHEQTHDAQQADPQIISG